MPLDKIDSVKPFSCDLWNEGLKESDGLLIKTNVEDLYITLLPRTRGVFKRNGLIVNGVRYKSINNTLEYLDNKEVSVSYNPDDVSYVWVFENQKFNKYIVIENFFLGFFSANSPFNNSAINWWIYRFTFTSWSKICISY